VATHLCSAGNAALPSKAGSPTLTTCRLDGKELREASTTETSPNEMTRGTAEKDSYAVRKTQHAENNIK